jgi:hypothetical protein
MPFSGWPPREHRLSRRAKLHQREGENPLRAGARLLVEAQARRVLGGERAEVVGRAARLGLAEGKLLAIAIAARAAHAGEGGRLGRHERAAALAGHGGRPVTVVGGGAVGRPGHPARLAGAERTRSAQKRLVKGSVRGRAGFVPRGRARAAFLAARPWRRLVGSLFWAEARNLDVVVGLLRASKCTRARTLTVVSRLLVLGKHRARRVST